MEEKNSNTKNSNNQLINIIDTFINFVCRTQATTEISTFWLRQEKDDQKIVLEDKDLEVIGSAIIKYGDSTVIMQHATTCLWVSYKVNQSSTLIKNQPYFFL